MTIPLAAKGWGAESMWLIHNGIHVCGSELCFFLLFRHGFGDCHKPLLESAIIVEEIVHQQLVALVGIHRNQTCIT